MGSTWLALRADLRVCWLAMAGLALLLGPTGRVVPLLLAAIAATPALAILIAAGPGRAAARIGPVRCCAPSDSGT